MSQRDLIPIGRNLRIQSNGIVTRSTNTNQPLYTQQQQYYVSSDDNVDSTYNNLYTIGVDNTPPAAHINNCSRVYPSYAPIPTPTTPIQPIQPHPQLIYLRNGSEIQNMSQYYQAQPPSIGTAQAVPTPTPAYETIGAVLVATKKYSAAATATS